VKNQQKVLRFPRICQVQHTLAIPMGEADSVVAGAILTCDTVVEGWSEQKRENFNSQTVDRETVVRGEV